MVAMHERGAAGGPEPEAGSGLEIDSLNIRIAGLTEDEARRLGGEVSRRLALRYASGALSAGRTRLPLNLGALGLRLALPSDTPRDRLPELIVAAILDRILR
jgi:hypothetical protein